MPRSRSTAGTWSSTWCSSVTATLGWWPILSPSTLVPPLPYAAQLLYLFVFGMPMTVVAAMVTAAERVLYPFYEAAPRITDLSALADQRLGGVIMWVPSGLIPLAVFTAVFFRWAAAEAEEPRLAGTPVALTACSLVEVASGQETEAMNAVCEHGDGAGAIRASGP